MGVDFDNPHFYMDGKAIKYLDQSKAFRRQKKAGAKLYYPRREAIYR